MSSFSELHASPSESYNADDGLYYNNQLNGGKRSLRRSFERQLSDKHLKRRTQVMQMQNNNSSSSNRRFLYQNPLATISSSSLPQQQLHENSQYEWHRCCPDRSGFFTKHRRKRSLFLLCVTLALLLLLFLPTMWYSTILSSTTGITTLPGMGGNSGSEDSGSGDSLRSYQDLANSIRSLRKRREALRGEEDPITNDDDDNESFRKENNNNEDEDEDEEDLRLKLLEQKVQRDQNEKIRHELDLSKDKERQHLMNPEDLKEKAMSDSIEALKLLNKNNHKND